jgi:hypothetical protein
MSQQSPLSETSQERPPVLTSWRNLYAVVLGELTLLIILFYLFTKAFE